MPRGPPVADSTRIGVHSAHGAGNDRLDANLRRLERLVSSGTGVFGSERSGFAYESYEAIGKPALGSFLVGALNTAAEVAGRVVEFAFSECGSIRELVTVRSRAIRPRACRGGRPPASCPPFAARWSGGD